MLNAPQGKPPCRYTLVYQIEVQEQINVQSLIEQNNKLKANLGTFHQN